MPILQRSIVAPNVTESTASGTGRAFGTERLAKSLKIELDNLGFFKEKDLLNAPLESSVEGIYLCGGATGPIDISESVVQASAASMKAILKKVE